jgi:hypothetical protein
VSVAGEKKGRPYRPPFLLTWGACSISTVEAGAMSNGNEAAPRPRFAARARGLAHHRQPGGKTAMSTGSIRSNCEISSTDGAPGQPLDRAVTAISPLTRSLERAATLFRTRPLPCHHPLTGNWDGSLISTRSHWLISSRTTEANASRFSAQIAKRWEPGRASNGVKVTIGFTWSGASRLATGQLRGYRIAIRTRSATVFQARPLCG